MRAWAASRAVEVKSSSVGVDSMGLGSLARRLPRSKVKGVGLLTVMGLESVRRCGGEDSRRESSYNLPEMVESATDMAPLSMGDFMSIAPSLILSASWECVSDATLSATPPFISVSDMLRCVCEICDFDMACRSIWIYFLVPRFHPLAHPADFRVSFLAAQASSPCIAPSSPL